MPSSLHAVWVVHTACIPEMFRGSSSSGSRAPFPWNIAGQQTASTIDCLLTCMQWGQKEPGNWGGEVRWKRGRRGCYWNGEEGPCSRCSHQTGVKVETKGDKGRNSEIRRGPDLEDFSLISSHHLCWEMAEPRHTLVPVLAPAPETKLEKGEGTPPKSNRPSSFICWGIGDVKAVVLSCSATIVN